MKTEFSNNLETTLRQVPVRNRDLEETCDFLRISPSTYKRHEKKGLAPQGKKLFGRKKHYPIGEVNLFADGKWKPEEWIIQEVQK